MLFSGISWLQLFLVPVVSYSLIPALDRLAEIGSRFVYFIIHIYNTTYNIGRQNRTMKFAKTCKVFNTHFNTINMIKILFFYILQGVIFKGYQFKVICINNFKIIRALHTQSICIQIYTTIIYNKLFFVKKTFCGNINHHFRGI